MGENMATEKRHIDSRLMLERLSKIHAKIKSGCYPSTKDLAFDNEVSIPTISIPVAVCINSHKDCGSRVLYVERVEVKSYIFIALGRTWETSNHQNE